MGDPSFPATGEEHLLIAFSLSAHLLQRIRDSKLFASVTYCPAPYVPGTTHPQAHWEHEPPPVPANVWAKTTVLLTMTHVPSSAAQAPHLRFVQGMSAGLEHMLSQPFFADCAAHSRGLTVATASGVHATTIAEYVLMQCLNAVHRQSVLRDIQLIEKKWARTKYVPAGSLSGSPELRGSTMGILGYGGIGRECGRLAHAFGMHVLAANSSGLKTKATGFTVPGTGDLVGDIPAKWYSSKDARALREFLQGTDMLVIACPLTKETRGLISRATIACLKKSAFVVNVGRGQVVDHEALYEALEEERIAGAILDVTDPEPLPAGHKLWTAKNCVITPHIAGSGDPYEERCVDILETNLKRLADGLDVFNKVDVGKGY